jgi:hypothetical protein
MTIRKGQDWGAFESRPSGLKVVVDDIAASELITNQYLNFEMPLRISILNSGLSRTLGIKHSSPRSNQMLCTKFDVIEANYTPTDSLEVSRRCFVGNAFINRNRFFGKTIAILNSSFVGNQDWAPKAHPNDGKLDLIEFESSMSIRQRLTAFKLMKSGAHLPHPKIRYRQVSEFEFSDERSATLSIEGRRICSIKRCVFTVLPDAVNLYW